MQSTKRVSPRRNLALTFFSGASILGSIGMCQTTQAGQPEMPLSNPGEWVYPTESQYDALPYPISSQQVSGTPNYGPLWNDYQTERSAMDNSSCECAQCTSKKKSPLRKIMSKFSSGFDRIMFGTSNNGTCDSCDHGADVSCDAESSSACDAMGTFNIPLNLAPIEPIVPIFNGAQPSTPQPSTPQPFIPQAPHSPVRTKAAQPQNGKQKPSAGSLEKRLPQPPQPIPSQLPDPFQDDPISTAPGGQLKRAGYFD